MSWRVTFRCTRAEAEAMPEADDLFPHDDSPPVLVVDEPDPARPDDWRLHAYFEREPTLEELKMLSRLAGGSAPHIDQLGEDDWVTMSQQGLEPIRAGRFFVHTPTHREAVPEGAVAFEIDAGLAFGTGQHATTAGCLSALDHLAKDGADFSNIADIGTGTGLLAFAAMALWPKARCIATDVDPIAIDVTRDNAAINRVPLGGGGGELLLCVADGMESEVLVARAPFDLLIANILAGPLIELAPAFAKAVAPDAKLILAGLLDTQAETVAAAYAAQGMMLVHGGSGEWPTLVLGSSSSAQSLS
ncbi:MAG TPA: 50S ribosomal protein L11 methyltransferase [Sphingomicrobium sp.]|nr:50S ribosomal protein L11 methyltransferase [Sphingomicrobium sp.]